MHDAAQLAPRLSGRLNQLFCHPRRCHVATDNHDLGAGLQFGQDVALLVSGIAAATQHHPAGAAVHQPTSDDQAETAEAAGDDVRRSLAHHRMPFGYIDRGARQPFDEPALAAPRDHVIMARPTPGIPQFRAQRGQRVLCDVQIDQGGAHVRVLEGEHPHQPFQGSRRGCSRLVVGNGKSAPGDQP
ncbi:hypothetical protein IQ40_13035 [Mycobacterium tuberculosis]|nr:hypothetical protein IQ40_13035 [Mycobacterium tuberculosis]KFC54083.1 hypothetical protein FF22_03518 [Mycobacterium tuberculosis]CKT34478.1 Uncharacterised protein [Mycobacterium tuberculosis]